MGNYRFRFASMIPNTWLYKAKNSGRTKTPSPSHSTSQPHHSINQQRALDHTQPRKSFKIRAKKIIIKSSAFACAGRSCYATTTPPNATPKLCTTPQSSPPVSLHQFHMPHFDRFNSTNGIVSNESLKELAIILSPQSCKASSSTSDIIRGMDQKSTKEKGFKKTRKLNSTSSSSLSKSISDSTAIVKSSFDMQKDFSDSMVEMILENNIQTPKDLEQLLTCYLFLNSEEHHDLIIKVFRQICTELSGIHF